MANSVKKTEHADAKNGGGGYWGLRVDANHWSNRARRSSDRRESQAGLQDQRSGND